MNIIADNKIEGAVLAKWPDVFEFGPKGYQELTEHVRSVDDSTRFVPIEDLEDVRLNDDGTRTKDGYRYSWLAFRQLCQQISPGLVQLAADIGGLRHSKDASEVAISVATAARVVNACARLRFRSPRGLTDRQMVQDTEMRTVDGIVGPGYRYLDHFSLIESATGMLECVDDPAVFHGASLHGRRLAMTYHCEKEFVEMPNGDSFHGGFYFGNSEAGECGVHAAFVLNLTGTELRCISQIQKLSHAGRSFAKKLGHLLSSVLLLEDQARHVKRSAVKLLETNLRVTRETLKSRNRRIVLALRNQGLDADLAKPVTRRAIFIGRYGNEVPRQVGDTELKERTYYDVFYHLIKQAEGLHPKQRELLERVAYGLLSQQFTL
jgi:hypothetical protein